MAIVEVLEANKKTVKLASGGTITLCCTNLFTLCPHDREFVLGLLRDLEAYENAPTEGGDDEA